MEVLKHTSPQAEARAPKPSPRNTEPSSRAKTAFITGTNCGDAKADCLAVKFQSGNLLRLLLRTLEPRDEFLRTAFHQADLLPDLVSIAVERDQGWHGGDVEFLRQQIVRCRRIGR